MTTPPYIDADGNTLPRPMLHVELPRCPGCEGTAFKVTRSIAIDDARQQSATCKVCGQLVFIVWE